METKESDLFIGGWYEFYSFWGDRILLNCKEKEKSQTDNDSYRLSGEAFIFIEHNGKVQLKYCKSYMAWKRLCHIKMVRIEDVELIKNEHILEKIL